MYIRKINGNTLTVNRSQDGTIASSHASGTAVNVINSVDDDLIDLDDDFGFSETLTYFDDSKTYSPTQGIDI